MDSPDEDDVISKRVAIAFDQIHKLVNDCYRESGLPFSDRHSETTWIRWVNPLREEVEMEIRSALAEQALEIEQEIEQKRESIQQCRQVAQHNLRRAEQLEQEVAEYDRLHPRKE